MTETIQLHKKLTGGLSLRIAGRPAARIDRLPAVSSLYMQRRSARFNFSTLCIRDAQKVAEGDVLAYDPGNFCVPLIAPRAGTVRLQADGAEIVLDQAELPSVNIGEQVAEFPHAPANLDPTGTIRYRLLKHGAWQYFTDAVTGKVPDPSSRLDAIIISMVNLEPFSARGDVLLKEQLTGFTRGLEHLQPLLEYQPIYLIFPKVRSPFAQKIKDTVRGYAWINLVEIPLRYPFDNPSLLARRLKCGGSVWTLRTEGVLAVDTVLTAGRSVTDRVIALGGPAAANPVHVRVPSGYPLRELAGHAGCRRPARIIAGGIFAGAAVDEHRGLDSENNGLTLLPESTQRTFLQFARPGFDRVSYSRAYASTLRPPFAERVTSSLCGEKRACISCGFCAEICPAGIVPSAIHKCAYQDNYDEALFFRPDLCIRCGLCSYVCPSKIPLSSEIQTLNATLREEFANEPGEVAK